MRTAFACLMLSAVSACPDGSRDDRDRFGTLQGTVYAPDRERTVQTTVSVDDVQQTECDTRGVYRFEGLLPGTVTVRSTAFRWLAGGEASATVVAGQVAVADLVMESLPLKLLPEDVTIAEAYGATYDWTQADLSISILARPTRSELQKALYGRNPALYDDWAQVPTLTPSPLPSFDAGGAIAALTFPVPQQVDQIPCSAAGEEAVDLSSVVDALPAAISETEQRDAMLWEPMEITLMQWDLETAADVYCVGTAIRWQRWGSDSDDLPPGQSIQQVYLHDSDGTAQVWVEIAFEPFVELGAGISDTNGDGRKELFAKTYPDTMNGPVMAYLTGDYSSAFLDAYELGSHLTDLAGQLYGISNPRIDSYPGTAVSVPGHGTLQYPFAVVSHGRSGVTNVLLSGP